MRDVVDKRATQFREIAARLEPLGLAFPNGLSDRGWMTPRPEALPILREVVRSDQFGWFVKSYVVRVMDQPWAARECAQDLIDLLHGLPVAPEADTPSEFHGTYVTALTSAIARLPSERLWPEILELARLPRLGVARGELLARAGRFVKHPDDVLPLLAEYVDDPTVQARLDVARGIRSLRDPRGLDLLDRLDADSEPQVRRAAQRARARLLAFGQDGA